MPTVSIHKRLKIKKPAYLSGLSVEVTGIQYFAGQATVKGFKAPQKFGKILDTSIILPIPVVPSLF